jgi:hypothetical protein
VATTPISALPPFELPESRLLARLLARIRGRAIDDQLLAGRTPNGNPIALARLAQLLDTRYRSKLARALRRLVDAARRPGPSRFVAEIPVQVRDVLETEPLILQLAADLETEEPVSPRGVILVDRLIRDGDSPVYWRCGMAMEANPPEASVETAVRHARAALHLG